MGSLLLWSAVPLLPLLSQRPSQRLMLIPISCTEDMALAMPDITDMLDTHTPMDTTERDLLMLSQRLMLIPISCTEDMVLAMLDIMDMLDTHTPTDTTERDPLMLSQRLMLLSSTELMDMVLDTEPTDMDTHMPMVPMDTMERDLLMLSQRLMLMLPTSMVDTTDMPDLMPMDTEATDTHTGDKSYTPRKNSTKQKLKANNILL